MTFTPVVLRGGRTVKALVESDPPGRPSYFLLVQLLTGAELIVSGKQTDMAVVVDWLDRCRKALGRV
ncbi:MAG TPA: hypothetical protein VFO85_08905 [Vicinamibacteria bacterium]|nr:hypothetical protein [Vicinamibacteria bacterium]